MIQICICYASAINPFIAVAVGMLSFAIAFCGKYSETDGRNIHER
jgi:hypothetical protein